MHCILRSSLSSFGISIWKFQNCPTNHFPSHSVPHWTPWRRWSSSWTHTLFERTSYRRPKSFLITMPVCWWVSFKEIFKEFFDSKRGKFLSWKGLRQEQTPTDCFSPHRLKRTLWFALRRWSIISTKPKFWTMCFRCWSMPSRTNRSSWCLCFVCAFRNFSQS